MKYLIKKIVPKFYLDYKHRQLVDFQELKNFKVWREKVWDNWIKEGNPIPPPHAVKQKIISDYKLKYNINNLIETGTLHGEMIEALKREFKTLFSIELDLKLFNEAKSRFKYDRNVNIVHGDSGLKIFDVIKLIDTKSIFWLDGHYSGTYTALGDLECPIFGEIDGIFSGKIKDHIILIDDARCFNGHNSYPAKEDLLDYIHKYNKNYKMSVDCDIIRLEV
jgi:hypothetical protein